MEIRLDNTTPITYFLAEALIGPHTFKGGIKSINNCTGEITLTVTRELAELGFMYGWSIPELLAEAARLQFPDVKDIKVMGMAPPRHAPRGKQFV
jgi:hypothetical protein